MVGHMSLSDAGVWSEEPSPAPDGGSPHCHPHRRSRQSSRHHLASYSRVTLDQTCTGCAVRTGGTGRNSRV